MFMRFLAHRPFRKILQHSATAVVALTASAAMAWPDKPVTFVVGYAAGGSVDAVARVISTPLASRLGQPIVIENVGGAGGSIGAAKAARARADGYTFLVGSGSEVAIAWAVNPGLKYNGLKDLAGVGMVATSPMVLVGNKSVPASDLNSLLQYSKSNTGKLTLATSGVGTPQHLLLEYINRRSGGEVLHVPYRSASTIMQDVVGGRVDLSVLTLSTALPFITSGQLRAYAVTSREPDTLLPGVASLTQAPSLKNDVFDLWFGVLAPAGTPKPMVERMNKELNAVLQLPEVRDALTKQGMLVSPGTPEQFSEYVRDDSAKYQRIIKEASIVVK